MEQKNRQWAVRTSCKYIGVIVFLFCVQVAFAIFPQSEDFVAERPEDFQLRQPDEEFLSHFRQDPVFDYTYRTFDSGWLDSWKRWLGEHLPWLRSWSGSGRWLYVFVEVGALIVLFFLVYYLVRSKYRHSVQGKQPDFERYFGLEMEQVNEVSYPVLLEQALDKRDYRLAVRVHFWYVLGLLDQQGVICRDVHRSNAAYLQEISRKQLRECFGELVRIFDCVCYGDFRVDKELYESICKKFNDFQQMLAG